jgi:tetratricopeptide (TPR) repeat protein
VLREGHPDEDLATLAAAIGRLAFFMGELEHALESVELALGLAESLWLPEVLSQALNTKSLVLDSNGRPEESSALLERALRIALQNDKPLAALRAYYNLSNLDYYRDSYDTALAQIEAGLSLARRLGNRPWEWIFLAELAAISFLTGKWDEAIDRAREIPHLTELVATRFAAVEPLTTIPSLHVARGDLAAAHAALAPFAEFRDASDLQDRAAYHAALAVVLRGAGDHAGAAAASAIAFEARDALGIVHPAVKLALVEAVEAAFAGGDPAEAERLLAVVSSLGAGERTRSLEGQRLRLGARLAALQGASDSARTDLAAAAAAFREVGMPFWVGVSLLELGESLSGEGRAVEAAPLLADAREIFERLKARPWLERLERVAGPQRAAV